MAKEKIAKKVMKKKPVKAKKKRSVSSGVAHIKATFNNTIITITDPHGNVIAWASAGKVNFSGSRKSSGFAATVAAQDVGKAVVAMGMKEIEIKLKGPGAGRESAIRGLASCGLAVTLIRDLTPVQHNGCRPRKRRRV
ncbi:MAG: 30S ribosomal protein S11 [Chlamydiia bacterium]|nr:30S ribosomal protein S11 [Chlamydiia bacterium]